MHPLQFGIVEQALDQFVADVAGAIPHVLGGLVFLVLAGVLAKLLMTVVRALLRRTLPGESDVYRRFVAGIVAAFLWFSIGLSFLAIVGLDDIASSLGTAAGFLALGVSYSLSSMIADAVAGVYLLRDPDFNPGDRVEVGDISGVVTAIELRKTRFRDEDGDTVVRGNAEIEKKWTKLEQEEAEAEAETEAETEADTEVEVEADMDTETGTEAETETEGAETAGTGDGADEGSSGTDDAGEGTRGAGDVDDSTNTADEDDETAADGRLRDETDG